MDNSPWLESHGPALYLRARRFLHKWRVPILNVFLFGFIPLATITFLIVVKGFSVWMIWAFFPGQIIMMLTYFGLANKKDGTVLVAVCAMSILLFGFVFGAIGFLALFAHNITNLPYDPTHLWLIGASVLCFAMIPAITYHMIQISNYMDTVESQGVQQVENEEE